jgi:hypothetical protein
MKYLDYICRHCGSKVHKEFTEFEIINKSCPISDKWWKCISCFIPTTMQDMDPTKGKSLLSILLT